VLLAQHKRRVTRSDRKKMLNSLQGRLQPLISCSIRYATSTAAVYQGRGLSNASAAAATDGTVAAPPPAPTTKNALLIKRYESLIQSGQLRPDQQQQAVIQRLASLLDELGAYSRSMQAYKVDLQAFKVCGGGCGGGASAGPDVPRVPLQATAMPSLIIHERQLIVTKSAPPRAPPPPQRRPGARSGCGSSRPKTKPRSAASWSRTGSSRSSAPRAVASPAGSRARSASASPRRARRP